MAQPPTPVVPTLGTTSFITNPTEILTYTLNHFVSAPKSQGSVFVEEAISLRGILAAMTNSPLDAIRSKIQDTLTECLNRISGESSSVEVETIEMDNGYTLSISMAIVIGGVPYTFDRNVTIDSDGRVTYK